MGLEQTHDQVSRFDFIKYWETKNIFPLKLEEKERYYKDILSIVQSMTGRMDVFFSNVFFQESIQLIVNSISLFEKGYFDCAFYSLRQSLEIACTAVFFCDDTDENRDNEMKKWRCQHKFPMTVEMIEQLKKRKKDFADIQKKMDLFFIELLDVRQKLNKYVHKQGYNKFYVLRNHPLNKNAKKQEKKLILDFTNFLVKSIGSIAVFRLAIDPLPILLREESIYYRTGDLITEEYNEDFINKYIGEKHIEAYKNTEIYKKYYNEIFRSEEMFPAVCDIVKDQYIDITKIDEILSQKHLLNSSDRIAVAYFSYSNKIAIIYCSRGLIWYHSNVKSKRRNTSFGTNNFKIFDENKIRFNVSFDEVFLSSIQISGEAYYFEHNEKFDDNEINELIEIGTILSTGAEGNLSRSGRPI